jgi:hypothetical protein
MRRALSLSSLLVSFLRSRGAAAAPTAPAPPQLAATSTARRVVLLSFDGLGADALARSRTFRRSSVSRVKARRRGS